MEQIKPAVSEEIDFEHRDKIYSSSFWNLRTIRLLLQGRKSANFQPKGLPEIEKIRIRPQWKNSSLYSQRKITCKIEVIQNKNPSAILEYHDFKARMKKNPQSNPSLHLYSFQLTT